MERDRATIFAPECRYKSWLGQSKGINYHWFTRSRIIGGLAWLTRHKLLSSMCYPLSWKACKINLICPSKSWFYSRHCYISMGRMPAYIPSFVKHLWSRNSNLLRITLSLSPGSVLVAIRFNLPSSLFRYSLNCASCFCIIVSWFTISNFLDWLETVKLRCVIFVRAWRHAVEY